MKIGQMIKILREACGLTQNSLAKASGVTQSFISKLESGEAVEVSFVVMAKIIMALENNLKVAEK